MARGPRSQSGGLQALYDRYVGDDPAAVDAFEAAKSNAEVARSIYRLRTEAGLTQRGLAALVGTTASVVCRLEDADYDGHSLSMLRRVAEALGRRVQIRFTPAAGAARPATKAKGGKAKKVKPPEAPKPPKPPKKAEVPKAAVAKKSGAKTR